MFDAGHVFTWAEFRTAFRAAYIPKPIMDLKRRERCLRARFILNLWLIFWTLESRFELFYGQMFVSSTPLSMYRLALVLLPN